MYFNIFTIAVNSNGDKTDKKKHSENKLPFGEHTLNIYGKRKYKKCNKNVFCSSKKWKKLLLSKGVFKNQTIICRNLRINCTFAINE